MSTYWSHTHRMPHHLFAGLFAFGAGILFFYLAPASDQMRYLVLYFGLLEGGLRLIRAMWRMVPINGRHTVPISVHIAEIAWLIIAGTLIARTQFNDDLYWGFIGVALVRASNQIFPVLDHMRSWKRQHPEKSSDDVVPAE